MKKYTNRIKLMPKFTKCMSLAMILTFTGYEEAFAEMSYAEQTSFTVSMENQTLKSVINWVEKNSQFIFIYRTDIDLSRRVNVDVRNKTIEEVLKQMFAGTDLEYHIRDRQVIIRKAISREETRPIVMQQDKVTVKGIVTDAKGEAIIGANIIEKGTTNGTITDIDGRFTLVVSEKASLVFSYIGYLTQEMLVGKKTFLNVQLQEDNKTLDEVVITGYGGTQLRSKMTNSIAKVDNSTLSTGAHTNPAQALSGAVAGLRVQQTSGNPNSTPTLVLRGGTNLDGSGSPLVIIDGAVRESLSDVNPEAPPLTATRASDVSNAGAPHTMPLGHWMPTLPASPRPGVAAVPASASIMPIAATNGRPWKACMFTSGRTTSENVSDASPALHAHRPADAPSRPASRAASSSVPAATAFISIIYIRPNSPTIWPTRSSGSLTSTPL